MIRSKRRIAAVLAAGATALALGLTGCSTPSSDDGGDSPTLRVWAGSQTPIAANFNPYAPTVLHAALGPIYETLFFFNKTADAEPTGLLAEGYEFNDDGTELTITVKDGVTWSDGESFSADDVAYSFNYEANDYATQLGLVTAEATDDSTVVLSFDSPQFTNAFTLLGSTWILPEHIWSEVDDFTTFTDENPVGTGPYTVDTVTDASYTIVANENYREEGKPAVTTVQYVGLDANQSAQDLLAAGELDWAGMFVPNPDDVTSNGIISEINTPQDPTVLYTCANVDLGCAGEQTDVAVRQALNLAIDRGTIKDKAFVGLTADISPTFALMPRDKKWVADEANAISPQTADVAAASKILEDAGYTKDGDGFYGKDGTAIELDLISVDGWTDYNDAAKLISEQAAAAGITVNNSTVQWQEYSDARQTGKFELIVGGVVGTSIADPYQIYKDWFAGGSTVEVGAELAPGTWNFSRYDNDVVNAAVDAASATNDEAAKKAAYATIQTEIVRDLPYIPLVINATQTFTNSKDFTGWPTESDLYAFPPAWGASAAGVILANIEPVN